MKTIYRTLTAGVIFVATVAAYLMVPLPWRTVAPQVVGSTEVAPQMNFNAQEHNDVYQVIEKVHAAQQAAQQARDEAAQQAEIAAQRKAAVEAAQRKAAEKAAAEAAVKKAAEKAAEVARIAAAEAARVAAAAKAAATKVMSVDAYKGYAAGRLDPIQFACLDTMWMHESGWNPNAQNPSSTAYGIPQFLDSTWATVGAVKTSDPYKQIDAGLIYIQNSYQTPCGAWSFWQANNWY